MSNILITGFAGSLGSEFTRQLLAAGHTVTGIDNNEWAVASFPPHQKLTRELGNFTDIRGNFDSLIHVAAYKHVDLLEANREAAWENNMVATKELYNHVEAKRVLFISTDKAVEPVSYYGMTKQFGEQLTQRVGGIVARLGNIINSSGSVIPKWEQAIFEGKPLWITDRTMTRYLIEAPLAVSRILSLWEDAPPKSVIIPDMGEPIPLLELADRVVEKHGLLYTKDNPYKGRVEDGFVEDLHFLPRTGYGYITIGIRPGEKLHEKVKWDWEVPIVINDNGVIFERREDETTTPTT